MEKLQPSTPTSRTRLTKGNSPGFERGIREYLEFPSARRITELSWALPCSRPDGIPAKPKLKGTKAQGAAYEKKIVKGLEKQFGESFNYHKWFCFRRTLDGKKEYCEPEMFLLFKNFICLMECKRTGNMWGKQQMENFYAPVLEKVYDRPVRCLLICKHVSVETPNPFVRGLEEFLGSDLTFATWHNPGF